MARNPPCSAPPGNLGIAVRDLTSDAMDPAADKLDLATRAPLAWLEIAEAVGAVARARGATAALESLREALDAAAVLLRSEQGGFGTLDVVSAHAPLARHRNVLGALPMTPIPHTAASTPYDVLVGDAPLRARWKRWGVESLIVTESVPGTVPVVRLEIYAMQPSALDAEAGFALRTLARELSAAVAIEHNRHPWLRHVDPRDHERLQRQLERTELLRAGNVLDGTYRFSRSGSTHHLQVWSTRVARGEPDQRSGNDAFMVSALDITRVRALERHIENLAARERRSVGRELHDGLCQDLIGLKIALDRQRRRSSEDPQKLVHTMASVSESLSECLRQARAIAQGLHPIHVSGDDLPAALLELAQTTRERFAVPIALEVRGSFAALSADEAVQLYWIAREAVLNAARHASATRIEVEVECKAPRLRLCVTDDGCGFDPQDPPGLGMGTRILERRARLIDADLRIESAPGTGTRVICDYEIYGETHGRTHED